MWILGDGRVFIFKASQPVNIIRTLGFREAGVRRPSFAKADLAQLALRNSLQLLVTLQTETIIPDVDREIMFNIATVGTCIDNRSVLQISESILTYCDNTDPYYIQPLHVADLVTYFLLDNGMETVAGCPSLTKAFDALLSSVVTYPMHLLYP